MKFIKRILIVFLLISVFDHIVIKADATDSPDPGESDRSSNNDHDGLLYQNGGTWIQGADGRWWYRHSDGSYTTSDWEYINGKWYYFDSEGWMFTGWLHLGNTWYYLLPSSGEMVTNWQYINGHWYYFTGSGAMHTGWLYDTNTFKHYYLDEANGYMVTGWKQISRVGYYGGSAYWNYFDQTGMFVTDSDAEGCTHGYSTFKDHKNLKGTTLKYFINPSCNFASEISTAANSWNQTSASLTRIYSTLPTADVLFFNYSSDDFYGHTYHYYSSTENLVSPENSNWHYCRIALNPVNDTPVATIAHEIGHAYGLSHRISNFYCIMQAEHDYRAVSSPQSYDVNVLNHLY